MSKAIRIVVYYKEQETYSHKTGNICSFDYVGGCLADYNNLIINEINKKFASNLGIVARSWAIAKSLTGYNFGEHYNSEVRYNKYTFGIKEEEMI